MLGLKLEAIDEIRKKGFRPQVVGCFIHDQKILMVYKKYSDGDLWQLPQGGVDNKETLGQAFWRECTEELGSTFMATCQKNIRMIGAAEIKFPYDQKNMRELSSDEGKDLDMRGKKYFFIAAQVAGDRLEVSESEFDDYKWLSHSEAIKLAETINQPRKLQLTKKVLNLLKKKEFIK